MPTELVPTRYWKRTVAPAFEPVTLTEVKAHLRVDGSDEDTILGIYISSAREWGERFCRRVFCTSTWALTLHEWPEEAIEIPNPPLASVTTITYVDGAGAVQTWSSSEYTVRTAVTPGLVIPKYGYSWPSHRSSKDAIVVTYVAGQAQADIPTPIKVGLLQLIAHWFENREEFVVGRIVSEVPGTVQRLLWAYRLIEV